MMTFLAGALGWLIGPGFKLVSLPALGALMLWFGGQTLEARRDELRRQGAQACIERTRLAQVEANARHDIAAAEARAREAEATASALLEVRDNAARLEVELESYRVAAANRSGPDAERCLSDGVRKLATGGR